MKPISRIAAPFAVVLSLNVTAAQQELSVEFYTGVPYNIPLPLTIHQTGQADISATAHYYSEPFVVPISWVWRISYWSDRRAWELEAVHHKIFLDNKPQEIQEFAISHGLNIITINRAWDMDGYQFRVGAGVAVTHPEVTIRGKTLAEDQGILHLGYYISGPALNVAVGKRIYLVSNLFLAFEAKAFSSYLSIPVEDGTADVYHVAFQASFGLGYGFAF